MKKNILIIGLAGMLGISSGLISCAPDYETDFNVSTLVVPDKSQSPIIFPLGGGEQAIEVKTNVPFDNWTATSNAEWCKIVKQADKVLVSAAGNEIYKQRKAVVTIEYGHQSYAVNVSQFGLEPAILIGDEMKQEGHIELIDAETTSMDISIATNMELDNIIIPDTCSWVHLKEQLKTSKGPRAEGVETQTLTFGLEQNTDTLVRYCTVILQSSQNYNYVGTFLIKQTERGYIVDIDDSKKQFDVKASGETITIPFQVNGPQQAYTYQIEESAKSWIVPAPATRGMRDTYESFDIKPNIVEEPRVGHITFRSTDPKKPNEFTVTVNQGKFIPVPPEGVVNLTAIPYAGFIKLKWDMPEDVNFTTIKISYYDKVANQDKEIVIDNNAVTSYIIDDTYQCAGAYKFIVNTYGPTGMATEKPAEVSATSGEAVIKARITLTLDMLSANATQTDDGGGLPALIDDNKDTYYHSLWSGLSPNSAPHHIQVNLTELPVKTIRFEYDGRAGNNGGDVKRAGIWGSQTGQDNTYTKLGTVNYNLPEAAGGHGEPTENVTADKLYNYIRFIPEAIRSRDPLVPTVVNQGWFNMSNLYLYKINKHDEVWAKKELGI